MGGRGRAGGARATRTGSRHFGRFAPLPDNLAQPLALRYHGHQFRVYNPDIGDGRGFLFAQLRDGDDGRLLDLGTKGSGQTPYSRFGDGRLTLKGGVREVLATEMLEALGVDTSKTFSLIETGEALDRGDEPSPTRSAGAGPAQPRPYPHRHLPAARLVRRGRRYRRWPIIASPPVRRGAGGGRAGAAARPRRRRRPRGSPPYIAAGFVHGVLNSDNIAITAESFDYGPWRWTPAWDGHFTAAYFDHSGLYAFGRQPQAIHWDLVQARICRCARSPRPRR